MSDKQLQDRAQAALDLGLHLETIRRATALAHMAASRMWATPDVKAALSKMDREAERIIRKTETKLCKLARKNSKLTTEAA